MNTFIASEEPQWIELGGGQQADGLFVGAEQLKIQRFIIRRGGGPLSVCNRDSLPRAGRKNQARNHL